MAETNPTSVYLYYDKHDVLIYVGITSRGIARQREHERDKPWWPFVARQTVEHYPSRQGALDRERSLIEQFYPPFNTAHNSVPTRDTYLELVSIVPEPLMQEPASRWVDLRIVTAGDDFLVAVSNAIDSAITSRIVVGDGYVVAGAGRKPKVRVQHIGPALAVHARVRDARDFEKAALMYGYFKNECRIKRIELTLAGGAS